MDHREVNRQWWHEFDENRMTAILIIESDDGDEVELAIPCKFEVCETCDGRGSHVNPAIDSHGISPEEFAEDPDFEESYFRGDYDIPCNECKGRRVVPVPVDDATTEQVLAYEERLDYLHQSAVERDYERRMGF
jgi:hypothetical protein